MSELEKPTPSSPPKKRVARKKPGPAGGAKRKAASSKPAARKKTSARRASPGKKAVARAKAAAPRAISAEERVRLISEAAYFRAEKRGFRDGDPERDWLEAEAEVDALLLRGRAKGE